MPNDILLNKSTNDLVIQNGDLVIGESTRQHQQLLLLFEKGDLIEFPTHGVGTRSWINDDVSFADLKAEIKREFERDGMRVTKIAVSSQTITTEANYD